MKNALKAIYHRTIPSRIRYPVGHVRRTCLDTLRRGVAPGPLPPRRLLQAVQMTPWIDEYLRVGERSHLAIDSALKEHGLDIADPTAPARLLDFGCGLGRTLRFFRGPSRRLAGCDVDPRLVTWSAAAFPEMDIRANDPMPPLPWPNAFFDALWAVSVFTHFPPELQSTWAREMARLLRPGGLAVISSMGPHALGGFANLATDAHRSRLSEHGFFFHPGGSEFNANGAFHTEEGLARFFGPDLDLLTWTQGGLDGFQDLSVFCRADS